MYSQHLRRCTFEADAIVLHMDPKTHIFSILQGVKFVFEISKAIYHCDFEVFLNVRYLFFDVLTMEFSGKVILFIDFSFQGYK